MLLFLVMHVFNNQEDGRVPFLEKVCCHHAFELGVKHLAHENLAFCCQRL